MSNETSDKQEKSPLVERALKRLHDRVAARDDLELLKALLLEYAKSQERIEQLERELTDMTDDYMRLLREKQDALNASLLQSATLQIPEGYKLVPIEPTDLMVSCGYLGSDEQVRDWAAYTKDLWRRMLEAVPRYVGEKK